MDLNQINRDLTHSLAWRNKWESQGNMCVLAQGEGVGGMGVLCWHHEWNSLHALYSKNSQKMFILTKTRSLSWSSSPLNSHDNHSNPSSFDGSQHPSYSSNSHSSSISFSFPLSLSFTLLWQATGGNTDRWQLWWRLRIAAAPEGARDPGGRQGVTSDGHSGHS